jgi:hypothetical protein
MRIRAKCAFSSKMEGFWADLGNLGLSVGWLRNQARDRARAQMATSSLKPSRDPADSYLGAGLAASKHPTPLRRHRFARIRAWPVERRGIASRAGRMSTRCSGGNAHMTNRGHSGDFHRAPCRSSAGDLEGPWGWFQNGKRVPIWKSPFLQLGTHSSPAPLRGGDRDQERQTGLPLPTKGEL